MKHQFDELAKSLAQSVTRTLRCMAVAAQFAWPALAQDFQHGPLILVSSPDPLAGCNTRGAVLDRAKHSTDVFGN